MKRSRSLLSVGGAGVILASFVAVSHDVPRAVPPEQAEAAKRLISDRIATDTVESFPQEVALILAVQDSVLAAAPVNKGLPEGQSRELTDLIKAGHGLCFDRSRAIETVLRTHGFEVRHAAIYSTEQTRSALQSILTPRVASHAATEVKTRKGWMLVDSNHRWVGLTPEAEPVDLEKLQELSESQWHASVRDPLPWIYNGGYTWVYGLYSRHGRFYPPYNAIPDVSWIELTQNF